MWAGVRGGGGNSLHRCSLCFFRGESSKKGRRENEARTKRVVSGKELSPTRPIPPFITIGADKIQKRKPECLLCRLGREGRGGSLWLLQVNLYGGARAPNTPAPRPGSGSKLY